MNRSRLRRRERHHVGPGEVPEHDDLGEDQHHLGGVRVDFDGLVSPNGKACESSKGGNDQSCKWENPPDQPAPGAFGTMFDPTSDGST